MVTRRMPRWSELSELIRPRVLPGDATDRRLARLEHVLRWWGRWLPTPQNSSAAGALPAGSGPAAVPPTASQNGAGRRPDTLTVPATRLP